MTPGQAAYETWRRLVIPTGLLSWESLPPKARDGWETIAEAARTTTACQVCNDTGIVWSPEPDGDGVYESACPEPIHDESRPAGTERRQEMNQRSNTYGWDEADDYPARPTLREQA